MIRTRTAAVAFLLGVATLITLVQAQRCNELLRVSSVVDHLYTCQPSPFWELQHLWSPVTVTLACASSEYEVHLATSEAEVLAKIARKAEPFWCGWGSFWRPNECVIKPSPYETKYIGIRFQPLAGDRSCESQESQSFSVVLPVLGVVGMVLFLFAGQLSASTAFRLSSGTAIFTTLSLAILVIVLFRMMPHKKKFIAALFAMGSTTISVTKWAYGKWLPSMREVAENPFFLAYVAVSAVVGLVLTYIFDNSDNAKYNTIFLVGLRCVGLGCLYFSTTSTPASALLLLSLTLYSIWPSCRSYLRARHTRPTSHGIPVLTPVRSPSPLEPQGSTYRTPPLSAPSPPAPACSSTSLPERTMTLKMRTPPPTPAEVLSRCRPNAPSPFTPLDPSRTPGAATPTLGPEESYESLDNRSPLVQRGLIVNGRTGKTIKLGGATFNNLVAQGYNPDYVGGMLTPPEGGQVGGLLSPRPSGGRGRKGR